MKFISENKSSFSIEITPLIDIVFLLVESTNFDPIINYIVINYYYKTSVMYNSYDVFINDLKIALCIFPFFVMVWFNSENRDKSSEKYPPKLPVIKRTNIGKDAIPKE